MLDKALNDFYNNNYEYKRTVYPISMDKRIDDNMFVSEGKIVSFPYREYSKVVESNESTLWNEVYYYSEGRDIISLVNISNEWISNKTERSYPYGYNKKLHLLSEREETINNTIYTVYFTEYKVNIGTKYHLSDAVYAVIKQKYYINKDREELTRIDTDLSDLQKKTFIANDMSINGKSLNSALNDVEGAENMNSWEKLEIYNIGEKLEIEIPDY